MTPPLQIRGPSPREPFLESQGLLLLWDGPSSLLSLFSQELLALRQAGVTTASWMGERIEEMIVLKDPSCLLVYFEKQSEERGEKGRGLFAPIFSSVCDWIIC